MKFFTLVCVVAVVVLARAYNPADPRCKGFDNDMLSTECARSLHRPQDRAEWYYDVDTNLCQTVGRDNNDTCWANFNNTFKDVMICVQTCVSKVASTSKPILTPNKTSCEPLPCENCQWQPPTCSSEYGNVRDHCKIKCDAGYEIFGRESVFCTPDGWKGFNGLQFLPECRKPSDVTEEIIDKLNNTMGDEGANILFVLDESASVKHNGFDLEIRFMKGLIEAFPLSVDHRSSGAITYATTFLVDIALNTVDTCWFMVQADAIPYRGDYFGGSTNTLLALQTAITEINLNAIHNRTIVFLLTDGGNQKSLKTAGNNIKSRGGILFIIGFEDHLPKKLIPLASQDQNGKPLFFGIDTIDTFKKMTEYLVNLHKNSNHHVECDENVTEKNDYIDPE